MRNRDVGVKTVLLAFGLAKFTSNGSYEIDASDTDKVATFNKCFSSNSAFPTTCEPCNDKIKNFMEMEASTSNSNTAGSSNAAEKATSSFHTPHNENGTLEINPIVKSRVILHPPTQIQNQTGLKHGSQSKSTHPSDNYEIYITKFDPDTECEKIADFILENTSLKVNESFKVKKLFNVKKHIKPKSFVSFHITASNSDNFDVLMNSDLWGPNFTATRFIPKKQMMKTVLRPSNVDVPTAKKNGNKLQKQQTINGKAKKVSPQPRETANHCKRDHIGESKYAGTSNNVNNVVQHGISTNSTSPNLSSNPKQPCRGGCCNVPGHIWPPYYGNNINYGPHTHQTAQPSNFHHMNNHMPPFRMPYAPMFQFHPQMFPYY